MIPGIKLTKKKIMKNTLIVTCEGDMNDGDYVNSVTYVKDKDFVRELPTLLYLNDNSGDIDTEDLDWDNHVHELVMVYCPHSEYGVHGVDVTFEYIDEDGVIFDASINSAAMKKLHPELFI
jgi:hypothetical protein